jgi:regulatory protein
VELKRKLAAKGFAGALVDVELERLSAERLQDDGRFAESYAHYRVARGYGPLKIRAELRERGVDEDIVSAVLGQLEIDWSAHILAVWRKKFSNVASDFRGRAKQARFLQYRGFTHDQIARVLDSE